MVGSIVSRPCWFEYLVHVGKICSLCPHLDADRHLIASRMKRSVYIKNAQTPKGLFRFVHETAPCVCEQLLRL